jgi:hypothetical protein
MTTEITISKAWIGQVVGVIIGGLVVGGIGTMTLMYGQMERVSSDVERHEKEVEGLVEWRNNANMEIVEMRSDIKWVREFLEKKGNK